MNAFWEDCLQALHRIRRNQVLTVFKLGLVAVGLGSSVTVFSIYNAVFMRPVPYPNGDRIVVLGQTDDSRGDAVFTSMNFYSYEAVKTQGSDFNPLGYFTYFDASFQSRYRLDNLYGIAVSPEVFEILGVKAHLGNTVNRHSSRQGAERVVVIGFPLWQSHFAGDPGVIEESVRINDLTYRVCGVMPAGFRFVGEDPIDGPQFWALQLPEDIPQENKKSRYFMGVGLLNSQRSLDSIQIDLSNIGAGLREQYPRFMARKDIKVRGLKEYLTGDIRLQVNVLMGVALLLLAITTANLSQLCLAQNYIRMRDYAIRQALGARSGHLFRMLMIEHTLLCLLGAGLGALGGTILKRKILELLPFRPFEMVDMDTRVLIFFMLVVAGVSLISTWVPLIQMRRLSLESVLREGGMRMVGDAWGKRIGKALIVAEIALCSGLLSHCGWLLASGIQRSRVPNPVEAEQLFCVNINLREDRYPDSASRVRFMDRLVTGFRLLPEVESAAYGSQAITQLGGGGSYFMIDDRDEIDITQSGKLMSRGFASPDYLKTLGLQLMSGRMLLPEDTADKPMVAVISQTAARKYWPGESPIGRRIRVNHRTDDWSEIVGIVEDTISADPQPKQVPMVWKPASYALMNSATMILRLRRPGGFSVDRFKQALADIDPETAYWDPGMMDDLLTSRLWPIRLLSHLLQIFVGIVLLISFGGIFSAVYFSVAQRMAEFSLRIALGATSYRVKWGVLAENLLPGAVGLGLGLLLAAATQTLIRDMLFQIGDWTGWIILSVSLIAMAATIAGSIIPAFRAAHSDPLKYLRES
ncbi:MAG: ABC transporter permease [Opitutales bacterium]|nr:ABC transporter permease [Opitutales bacterium]